MNALAHSFGIHGSKRLSKSVRPRKKNRQAGEQETRGNSKSLRSGSLIFLDPLIEMRMFSAIASESGQGAATLNL